MAMYFFKYTENIIFLQGEEIKRPTTSVLNGQPVKQLPLPRNLSL